MTTLERFAFAGQQVRTAVVDGEPWFVIADVAKVLDLSNPSSVANSLDDDDLSSTEVIDSLGRRQKARVTNEAGLYRLIFQSRKPDARSFQRWVTHEVLPAIRRTGQFGSALPTSFAEALEVAAAEARKVEALEAAAVEAAPKVEAFDRLMDADGYYDMNSVAKMIGTGRNRLYARLRDKGIILRGSTQPAQRYVHHFKLTTSTRRDKLGVHHVQTTTRLRPEGLGWLLKRLDIAPLPGMADMEIPAVAS